MAEKKFVGFPLFLSVYFATFIILAVVLVLLFIPVFKEYEYNLPKNVAERYVTSFDEGKIRELTSEFVATLDRNIESEDESYAELFRVFGGKASCRRMSSKADDFSCAYEILIDGKNAGEILLETKDPKRGGFVEWIRPRHWTVTGGYLSNLEGIVRTAKVYVPAGTRVFFNGTELGDRYKSGWTRPIGSLKVLYAYNPEIPELEEYIVDGFIGEHEFSFTDEAGNPLNYVGDGVSDDDAITDNCSEEEKAALDEFTAVFLQRFVNFNSNAGAGFWHNLTQLRALCVRGTTYYNNLETAGESLQWTSPHHNSIDGIEMKRHFRVNDNLLIVSFTYLYSEGYGNGDRKQASCDVDLLIQENENGYLVETCITGPPVEVE